MKSIFDLWGAAEDFAPSFRAALAEQLRSKHVAKGEILQRQGGIARHIFFVRKGLLRTYATDASGKMHTFMFGPEGWIVSDAVVHLNDVPAALTIEALEDSEVDMLDLLQFKDIPSWDAAFDRQALDKLNKRVAVLQKRIIMLMGATAQERFEDFILTYPDILQRVPQKMVASYLGITPEALSSIKGKMLRK